MGSVYASAVSLAVSNKVLFNDNKVTNNGPAYSVMEPLYSPHYTYLVAK
jgi:hypothetical protein